LQKDGKTETNSLIRVLFMVLKHDEKGREIFCNEPGIEVRAGKVLKHDIAAEVMCVD